MANTDRVIRAVQAARWAIEPQKLDEILGFLEAHAAGESLSKDEVRERFTAGSRSPVRAGAVAVIPLYGTISHRTSMLSEYSGGTSTRAFCAAFDAAVSNEEVTAIVIDCDSPGGNVVGVEEAFRKVYAARGKKRTIAVSNGLMASAAYWICCAADEIAVTPSGEVGSIGVFAIYTDASEAYASVGIKHTIIRAGKYKAEMSPYETPPQEAFDAAQAEIDEIYDMFVAAVAKGRGVRASAVRNGFGEGRCLSAKRAVSEGMADRVATLEEVLSGLGVGRSVSSGRRAEESVAVVGALDGSGLSFRGGDMERVTDSEWLVRARECPDVKTLAGLVGLDVSTLTLTAAAEPFRWTLVRAGEQTARMCPDCGAEMEQEDDEWFCPDCKTGENSASTTNAGGAVSEEITSTPDSPAAPVAKENTVENITTTAAPGTPGSATIDVNAAIVAERKRAGDVRALALSHGLDAAKANALADEGLTVEAAAARILAEIQARGASSPSIQVGATREGLKPFASLGEQLLAIREAAMPGRVAINPRLMEINAAATGAGSDVPSDGGFLIEKDLAPGIVDRMYDLGEVTSRVRRVPIGPNANGLKINAVDESSRANGSRWGGVQAYWAGEADTVTATKPKFRQMEMDLKKLFGLMYMTDELVQDATALSAVAEQAFSEELTFKAEDGVFRGTGAGQPLGFLNSGALVSVAAESAQTADTINTTNVLKMWSRLWARSRRNAAWFINQEIEPQLYPLTLGSGTAVTLLYTPAGVNGNATGYGRLMGAPVIPVEYASAIGDVGDISLVDLDQYLMIDKDGPQQAYSIHVRFIYDEQVFRVTYRVDGQPIWNKPLTPYKGASTLSPFVTLAAR